MSEIKALESKTHIERARAMVNALRASYGAPPTEMTDEQIAAGLDVYGSKANVDMMIIDELEVIQHDR